MIFNYIAQGNRCVIDPRMFHHLDTKENVFSILEQQEFRFTQYSIQTEAKSLLQEEWTFKFGVTPKEVECGKIDCSTFIQSFFKSMGIELPRMSVKQAELGIEVRERSDIKIGDLIFFKGAWGGYYYSDPKKLIGHASVVTDITDAGEIILLSAREKKIGYVTIEELGRIVRSVRRILASKDVMVCTPPDDVLLQTSFDLYIELKKIVHQKEDFQIRYPQKFCNISPMIF